MVFFANSGAGTPGEPASEQAAAEALFGGARIYRLIGRLEDRSRKWTQKHFDVARSASDSLAMASQMYAKLGDDLFPFGFDYEAVAEKALAGDLLDSLDDREFRSGAKGLYRALSDRLASLSELLRTLDFNRPNSELRRDVFKLMREWEVISGLARMISVVNSGDGGSSQSVFTR